MGKIPNYLWRIFSLVEIILCVVTIILDLFIPTIVLVFLMGISLLIRHEHITTMGFKKPKAWLSMIGITFVAAFFLQLFDAGVTMPILNRVTHSTLQYDGFVTLKGNIQQLGILLLASWTLAAFLEELAYRGYLQDLLTRIFLPYKFALSLSIIFSSILFGLAHTEQGIIGVVVTTIDAIIFSIIKHKFDNNLWAAVLIHGFYNSIGVLLFFFTGPIYGLW